MGALNRKIAWVLYGFVTCSSTCFFFYVLAGVEIMAISCYSVPSKMLQNSFWWPWQLLGLLGRRGLLLCWTVLHTQAFFCMLNRRSWISRGHSTNKICLCFADCAHGPGSLMCTMRDGEEIRHGAFSLVIVISNAFFLGILMKSKQICTVIVEK